MIDMLPPDDRDDDLEPGDYYEYEDDDSEEPCDHGCWPSEICPECEENGCNFSEDEECSCWMRRDR